MSTVPVMRVTLYYLLLSSVLLLCLWRGRGEERAAAIICVAGTLLTVLAASPLATRFSGFETSQFLIDLGVLLAFLVVALRSTRFWPLWVTGLQLTATSVHLLMLFYQGLMSFVVAAALAFWSYPILILIAVGAWRTRLVEGWREARLPDAL